MIKHCFSCNSQGTLELGETHKYLLSSPSCWAKYGQILEKEYSNQDYFKAHRLTVDAYALQHPGIKNSQTIQSSIVHLASLHMIFHEKVRHEQAVIEMARLTNYKDQFLWLAPPQNMFAVNVDDILKASTAEEHYLLVRKWALFVYQQWHEHIPYIESLLKPNNV